MNYLKKHKKIITIILTPILASIIPLTIQTKPAKGAFVVILMSVYWLTEALPMGITSLLPVLCFPLLGILPSERVTEGYFKDIVMLFFGGLVVANAIEITHLHERIALKVLMKFGSDPKWLMLGFMLTTAFLSLWISNTAATSMMLPIVHAVVKKLIQHDSTYHDIQVAYTTDTKKEYPVEFIGVAQGNNPNTAYNTATLKSIASIEPSSPDENFKNPKAKRLVTGFLLSTAYSATMGGLGSLVGTATNVLIKGYFDKNYPNANLNFLTFFLYAFPVALIMIFISWIWIILLWIPKENWFTSNRRIKNKGLEDVLKEKYAELGPTSWGEKCIGASFLFLITLWVTRDLHAIPGWGYFFKPKYISDTTPVIITIVLLFMCPKENIFNGASYSHLIDWKQLQKIFPWNIFLLLGGGLVMANGFQESGLSNWVGSQLKFLAFGSKEFIQALIIIISASATEFTSNVSTASIFLPIVDTLAKEINVSPTYLLLPMILSVSLAFMLPMATPNNAIIFSTGHLKIKDMIMTGILMNFIGFLVIFTASNIWLGSIFDLKYINQHNLTNTFNRTVLFY